MKAFWNDGGHGPGADAPVEVDLVQAQNLWSDTRGVEGNFLGLIDAAGRTVQFYFKADIPDGVDDARHLRIVLLDFPVVQKGGSYAKEVSPGEVHGLIALAFATGADPSAFPGTAFVPW